MGSSAIRAPKSAEAMKCDRELIIRPSLTLNFSPKADTSLDHTVRSLSTNPGAEGAHFSFDTFSLVRVIGTGSSACVYLAIEKTSSRPLALKVYSKANIIKSQQFQHVKSELRALETVKSQWLPNLLGCGQDDRRVFIAMEFVQGGELFRLLRKCGRFTLREAEFYASEVVCALSDMHAWKFVYRDLKPENVLVTSDGHIRLVDLQLAKFLKAESRTYTLCGTPEYMAPEVIEHAGHGLEADWWQLGILLYEMLSSKTPFYDPSPYVLYSNILTSEVKFPGYFSHSACHLISSLLCKPPKKRITEQQITSHSFFLNIEWSHATRQQLPPPMINRAKGLEDDSFFERFPEPGEWEKVDECFLGF